MIYLYHAALAVLPFSLLGLFFAWHIVRPQKAPADTSNRFNKMRALFWVAKREDFLARVLEWMKWDESQFVAQTTSSVNKPLNLGTQVGPAEPEKV